MKMWTKKALYRLTDLERGHLEGFAAAQRLAQAAYAAELQEIMKREGIPETDDVVFDPARMLFERKPAGK